jgi:hypothetical protein
VIALAAVLLAAGIVHRPTVIAHQEALQDAISRAEAFIGDRAPAPFRENVTHLDTYTIEPGSLYRTCVTSVDGTRTYCVYVNPELPFARSVTFAGYESNTTFAQGVN